MGPVQVVVGHCCGASDPACKTSHSTIHQFQVHILAYLHAGTRRWSEPPAFCEVLLLRSLNAEFDAGERARCGSRQCDVIIEAGHPVTQALSHRTSVLFGATSAKCTPSGPHNLPLPHSPAPLQQNLDNSSTRLQQLVLSRAAPLCWQLHTAWPSVCCMCHLCMYGGVCLPPGNTLKQSKPAWSACC